MDQDKVEGQSNRQAEELNAIFMAMAEIVIFFDSTGQAVRANLAALETLGVDPPGMGQEELLDLFMIRVANGTTLSLSDFPVSRALHGEMVVNERLLLNDKEAKERIFLVSASPVFDQEKISGVVSVWHDVTTREHLLEQLEIEQLRLEAIIEKAPEAILVADNEGRLVLANPAAEKMLVRPLPYRQSIDHLANLKITKPDGTSYSPRELPLVCSALDGELLSNVELLIEVAEGQNKHILASTAPIYDRKGNLNGAVGILQDITLRKRAEDDLRKQAVQSQVLAALSQAFAEAGLDHRELLKTIVSSIRAISGDICAIQLASEDGEWSSIAAFDHPDPDTGLKVMKDSQNLHFVVTEELRNTNQVICLVDASDEDIHALLPAPYRMLSVYFPIRNGLIIPLRAHGRWIGSLGLLRAEMGRRFDMEEHFFYQDLADRAALAIEDSDAL